MTNWKRVFFDDFPAGPDVDRVKWESPVWTATHNKANIGRTGIRNRQDFAGEIGLVPCTAENGADLRLSTYNPKAQPANSAFLGSEIYTWSKWGAEGQTVKFEAVVKCPTMPGGAITSVFAYALCTGQLVQNEIDFEFVSNHWSAPDRQYFTNIFACTSGRGSGPEIMNTGSNLQDWHTYSLIYTPSQSAEWLIDGTSVRKVTQPLPDWKTSGGMHLYMNFWVTDPAWGWAYNKGIQPTGPGGEQVWHYYAKSAAVYYGT